MPWFTKYLMGLILMDEAGDKGGGGGDGKPDPAKEMSDLKASNAALIARLEKLEGKQPDPSKDKGGDDGDLAKKAALQREADEKLSIDQKAMESALTFNIQGKDWLKTNAALLPNTIEGIFAAAEKENYGSAIEKASAIKVGIVSEFFAQQANLDLLTTSQKSALVEFQKLTKTGKQDRVQQVYDMVFEPAFETMKKVKKAESLRGQHADQTSTEKAYGDRLMQLSRQHYLGEKKNA